MQLLESLNPKQQEAVLHTEGPILIVAGAGAGKTKTLTHRIAHLIQKGVSPRAILAVTFTNKAAKEMRERLTSLLSENGTKTIPLAITFHGLGVLIIKEHAERLGLSKYFTIADEKDAVDMMKQAITQSGLDPKQHEPRKYKSIISKQKGDGHTPELFLSETKTIQAPTIARVWKAYDALLAKNHMLDFDDLLAKALRLVELHPDIRKKYQERFQYIHIDEYQDTNELQYKLSHLLVGEKRNICVVGDSDQNIYSWRGANIKNILHFEKDYPGAKVILLEQNYRSSANIIEAANAVIVKNSMRVVKDLFTDSDAGAPITLCEAYDEVAEAEYIASQINTLLENGITPDEIAILYRANFQSRVIEDALLRAHVPYQVLGTKFFERKEVKDVLAYLRASLNPASFPDIRRIINVPARGIGKVTIEKILDEKISELTSAMQKKVQDFYTLLERINEVAMTKEPSEVVTFIIKASGLDDTLKSGTEEDLERLENIRELVTVATSYDNRDEDSMRDGASEGLLALMADASLASDQDTLMESSQGVRMMTVHASKGLEFEYVFITGLEQDLFPHKRDHGQTKEQKEEERRLCYVALTRAKKKLFLSYATMRTIYGMRQINAPSEFTYDIPEHILERESTGSRYGSGGGKVIYLD